MSRRNTLENKQKRRLLKALRQTPEAQVDLIAWVRQRTRCTAGTARKVLYSGVLVVDSHPIGFEYKTRVDPLKPDRSVKVIKRYYPADIASRIETRSLEAAMKQAEND